MIGRKRQQRDGFSLVETLAFVTIASIVLTLMGKSLGRLLDHHQCTQRATKTQRSVSRLAMQFRRDVRRSANAAVRENEMNLTCSNGTVKYIANGSTLTTLHQLQGLMRREEYVLPTGGDFEFSNDSRSGLVTLVVRSPKPTVVDGSAPTSPGQRAEFRLVSRAEKHDIVDVSIDDRSVKP